MTIEEKIIDLLDEIRPSLQMDGGDVNYVGFDKKSGILEVRLMGRCAHCPMSQLTLKHGIEKQITKKIPQVKKVNSV